MPEEDHVMELIGIIREESKNHTAAVKELAVEYGKNNTLLDLVADQYEKVRKSLHEQNNLKQKEIELKSQQLDIETKKIDGQFLGEQEKWKTLRLIFEKPKDIVYVCLFIVIIALLILNFFGVNDHGLTDKLINRALP